MAHSHDTRRATAPPAEHDDLLCGLVDQYGWPVCPRCGADHEAELEAIEILDPLGSFSHALLWLDKQKVSCTVRDDEIVAGPVDAFTAAVIDRHKFLLIECAQYHADPTEVLV
jgi:hypothetical protein